MFEVLAVPAINRLLRSHTWALDRLREHAGKTALLACPPFTLLVSVTQSGELAASPLGTTADVTIGVTPGLLLRAASSDAAAWSTAQVTGDVEFAGALDYVRRNIEWDYEEDLSRLFGDIAAHRLASAAKRAHLWGRDTALKVSQSVAEYVTYEKPLVVSAHALEQFNREVDVLRDDVERIEKRLALLGRRLSESA
jgi:ubiquinone biosynthesis protein UbiJ